MEIIVLCIHKLVVVEIVQVSSSTRQTIQVTQKDSEIMGIRRKKELWLILNPQEIPYRPLVLSQISMMATASIDSPT